MVIVQLQHDSVDAPYLGYTRSEYHTQKVNPHHCTDFTRTFCFFSSRSLYETGDSKKKKAIVMSFSELSVITDMFFTLAPTEALYVTLRHQIKFNNLLRFYSAHARVSQKSPDLSQNQTYLAGEDNPPTPPSHLPLAS